MKREDLDETFSKKETVRDKENDKLVYVGKGERK